MAMTAAMQQLPIHILYEHPDWLPPLIAGLEAEQLPYALHELCGGVIDIAAPPPQGIYLNRISPSSHTRGHTTSVDLTFEYLAWLESYGRRVINGTRAFRLEVSKLQQDLALRRHDIQTPRTIFAVGTQEILAAAQTFTTPFITKHNCGGKGLGIVLFNSADELTVHLNSSAFDAGPRGQVILQQYINAADPFITRVEIVGGEFLYAMRSATTEGFQLCPSDACQIPPTNPDVCPIDGGAKFSPSPLKADDPLVQQYLRFCEAEGLEVAGIEFIEDAAGNRYTYDINGTTNYNSGVGREVGIDGMREVARHAKRVQGVDCRGALRAPRNDTIIKQR